MQVVDGQPVAADLRFEGASNQRRGRADACSKILFQYLARRQPITIDQLSEAAALPMDEASVALAASSAISMDAMRLCDALNL